MKSTKDITEVDINDVVRIFNSKLRNEIKRVHVPKMQSMPEYDTFEEYVTDNPEFDSSIYDLMVSAASEVFDTDDDEGAELLLFEDTMKNGEFLGDVVLEKSDDPIKTAESILETVQSDD